MRIPTSVYDDTKAVERMLKRYDEIPAIEKIPPINNREIEDIRWSLHNHLMNLNDESVLETGDDEFRELVDRATETLHDIVDKIQRTWNV